MYPSKNENTIGSNFIDRLPDFIVPKHYNLYISPTLTKACFTGTVKIFLEIKKPTNVILLNSAELDIKSAAVYQAKNKYTASKIEILFGQGVLRLSFNKELDCVPSSVEVTFSGILNDKLRGFYLSTYYIQSEKRLIQLAVTQFAIADARRCFPCFDEPALKATFDVSLAVPINVNALSNMEEISREIHSENDELEVVKFATSPLMSTYLVAFIVGDLEHIEKLNKHNIKVRVFLPVGKAENGRMALDVACKVLSFFTDYFQMEYPLSKLDNIAVPDFLFGAMENWGLITYRESRILMNPKILNDKLRQDLCLIIGHEIAHQWFGNLVTMAWWNDLWLNEGYATFCQYLSIDELFPEFDVWSQFYKDTYMKAMELDSLQATHPIEVKIKNVAEVDEIFDEISYCKGACVIRMIHDYIGDKRFRTGMSSYLHRHRYSTADTIDLWKTLEESCGKPIGSVMSSWTTQPGFPMLTVSCRQDANNLIITVTQQRLLSATMKNVSNLQWIVPITISTCKFPRKEFLLEGITNQIVLEKVPFDSWVLLNVGSIGFYRVHYSDEMLSHLLPAIKTQFLNPIDRLAIIDDLFTIVKLGHASTVSFLKVLRAYEEENDYAVLSGICHSLNQLKVVLDYSSCCYSAFLSFACAYLRKPYSLIDWPENPMEPKDAFLRSLIIGNLGSYGDVQVIKQCKELFAEHVAGRTLISPIYQEEVFKVIMRQNSIYDLDAMLQLYSATDFQSDRIKILSSLGATTHSDLIQKVLEFSISKKVRSQDSVFVLLSVAETKPGRSAVWAFYKNNIKLFQQRYEGSTMNSRLVKGITSNFASTEVADEVRTFLQKEVKGLGRAIDQIHERILINAHWLARDENNIEKYLNQHLS